MKEKKIDANVESKSISILKGNTVELDVRPVGTNIYIPYIDPVEKIFEVKDVIISRVRDMSQDGVYTFFYECKEKVTNEIFNVSVSGTICLAELDAKKVINDFLKEQIKSINEHTNAIKKQLATNEANIKEFTSYIKN